ncbi:hypothetical protein [Oerskovia flava]|uniref:hypothetical protein n=1 Tax=Oerskovia flava TaxID=2986422 RepID=UPI0022409A0D|nr:hypothetical protein [Oerskovia sp. JB1-3-2]
MWAFLGRRLRTLVIVLVLVPVVGRLARALANRNEAKHDGPTTTSRALRSVDGLTAKAKRLA